MRFYCKNINKEWKLQGNLTTTYRWPRSRPLTWNQPRQSLSRKYQRSQSNSHSQFSLPNAQIKSRPCWPPVNTSPASSLFFPVAPCPQIFFSSPLKNVPICRNVKLILSPDWYRSSGNFNFKDRLSSLMVAWIHRESNRSISVYIQPYYSLKVEHSRVVQGRNHHNRDQWRLTPWLVTWKTKITGSMALVAPKDLDIQPEQRNFLQSLEKRCFP